MLLLLFLLLRDVGIFIFSLMRFYSFLCLLSRDVTIFMIALIFVC